MHTCMNAKMEVKLSFKGTVSVISSDSPCSVPNSQRYPWQLNMIKNDSKRVNFDNLSISFFKQEMRM